MPELFASAFSVTIAVNLGTIPIIASIQGGLNFLTLITNLFSLAYFSFLFPFFVICLILNLIFPFLSFLLKFCDFGFGCLNQFAGYMASTNLQITFSKFDIITTIIIYLAIFVMSHILMSDRKVKVCFLCVLFGVFGLRLDFSTIKTCESGINVLNYYDSQSIVLESSHGNNALIFLNESDFIEKYKRNNNLNINYLFILGDIHKCTITNFNSSLYETIITTEDINIYDNINVVEQNVSYKITDFTFIYINSENLDGLLVEYDDLSIFIAKNLKDEIDVTLDCDVLIGTPINSFARAVVNEKSAYNFENYGNFKLVGNELKVRRLD